ncbi:MAG: hypothetical protein WA615_28080 [Bradyrhizobium sp.]|jgi:hypothetical protein|uniref:hypothetical protein n=1 Tax=Bradyrhizobium sp. TaxID=376 RepID=UPI003C7DBCDC
MLQGNGETVVVHSWITSGLSIVPIWPGVFSRFLVVVSLRSIPCPLRVDTIAKLPKCRAINFSQIEPTSCNVAKAELRKLLA